MKKAEDRRKIDSFELWCWLRTSATHTLDGEGCKQGDSGSHQTRNLTGSQDHQAMTDRFWSCHKIKLIKKFDNAWNGRWNKKRGQHKTHWIDSGRHKHAEMTSSNNLQTSI